MSRAGRASVGRMEVRTWVSGGPGGAWAGKDLTAFPLCACHVPPEPGPSQSWSCLNGGLCTCDLPCVAGVCSLPTCVLCTLPSCLFVRALRFCLLHSPKVSSPLPCDLQRGASGTRERPFTSLLTQVSRTSSVMPPLLSLR